MMQCPEEEVSDAPPTAINPTPGPVARKLLNNQLYRFFQEKARKCIVGAEIERHCDRCSSLEGKLVEMRDTFQRNLSEEGGWHWLLQVSIRHKYPFGKIDVPMADFMQDLRND